MPPVSGAGEQGVAIEDPIAAEARNRNPVALTAYLGEFFTVSESHTLHVSGDRFVPGATRYHSNQAAPFGAPWEWTLANIQIAYRVSST